MSQSLLATRTTTSEIQIEIDWPLLLEQRSAVLRHTETPAYLLLPEIHQLMDVVRQDNLLLMINTLWHTGARISECLALTPNHFVLDARQPYVSVETLKSRGRPKRAGRVKPRLVPLCDLQFIRQLERYIASHHIRKNQLLFPITRSAANKRFDRLVANMTHKPSIKITPHTFRHSFAVNAIFHGTPESEQPT
jgi:integrase